MDDSVIINKFMESFEFRQLENRVSKYTYEEWEAIKKQYQDIIITMLDLKEAGESPASENMQKMIDIWRTHISEFYYVCDRARLRSYYKLYKNETNYKRQLDELEKGFADFLADAIDFYLKNN